jgi:hypothetical protein
MILDAAGSRLRDRRIRGTVLWHMEDDSPPDHIATRGVQATVGRHNRL